MSAYVLCGLPILLALALTAINPEYMQPLWGTSSGHMMLMIGAVMMVIGALFLKKIVSFKG
jgi:tight adherence protein B